MKDLNINRDTTQPSDEALLKHQNFDEVMQKSGLKNAPDAPNLVSKKWWYLSVGSFVVLGVFVLTINSYVTITNDYKKSYASGSQNVTAIETVEFEINKIQNNILAPIKQVDSLISQPLKQSIKTNQLSKEASVEAVAYYYPKEVSTLTFKLDKAFGLKHQYQQFEEFSIYDNLAFQPIGDYQSGWLKASWTEVELVKKAGNYFLMLSKNGLAFPCQVIPVFESEDYVKALEVYAKAKSE